MAVGPERRGGWGLAILRRVGMVAEVTPAGTRDGEPDVLAGLCMRRGGAVLAYSEHMAAPGQAALAAADAFARFRSRVVAADELAGLDADALLLSATRHAAVARGVRVNRADDAEASEECLSAQRLVVDWMEDELSPAARERLERHVAGCAECGAVLVRFEAAERAYLHPPKAPVPPTIARSIVSALAAAAPVTALDGDAARVRDAAERKVSGPPPGPEVGHSRPVANGAAPPVATAPPVAPAPSAPAAPPVPPAPPVAPAPPVLPALTLPAAMPANATPPVTAFDGDTARVRKTPERKFSGRAASPEAKRPRPAAKQVVLPMHPDTTALAAMRVNDNVNVTPQPGTTPRIPETRRGERLGALLAATARVLERVGTEGRRPLHKARGTRNRALALCLVVLLLVIGNVALFVSLDSAPPPDESASSVSEPTALLFSLDDVFAAWRDDDLEGPGDDDQEDPRDDDQEGLQTRSESGSDGESSGGDGEPSRSDGETSAPAPSPAGPQRAPATGLQPQPPPPPPRQALPGLQPQPPDLPAADPPPPTSDGEPSMGSNPGL